MVDFKFLKDRPAPKYHYEALVADFNDQEPVWQELIFRAHELDGEHGGKADVDRLRDKLWPLGVRIVETATGKVVYTAGERDFGDRVQGIRL